ncbi:MAG: histidine kinase dimerization/phospho-acceptor domain-containing protein, partial [Candidatus Woesearchaeota archaeon]
MKIINKVVLLTVCVVMFSLGLLGLLFAEYATIILDEKLSEHLNSISILKENELNNYISSSANQLEALSKDQLVIWYMQEFSELHSSSQDIVNNSNPKSNLFIKNNSQYTEFIANKYLLANITNLSISDKDALNDLEEFFENQISENFNNRITDSEFEMFSIITLNGIVDISTEKLEENKIRLNEDYFVNGLNSTYYQGFYLSLYSSEQIITISTPIVNSDGEVLGVLAGNLRLDSINRIMSEHSGLGYTGETLLINKNHMIVSESRFIEDLAFKKTVYNTGVNDCISGMDGLRKHPDYRNIDVISYVNWISERDVCLITKIDKKEAHSAIDRLYMLLSLYLVVIFLLSLIVAYIFSKRFTKPILNLVKGTEEWKKGNITYTVPVSSDDELSILCQEFNRTANTLEKFKKMEEDYSEKLKTELEKKTKLIEQNLVELNLSKKALINMMEDIAETNTHLKDLDTAKTDFLNVASHELKTPLTAISAYLEILDDYKGEFSAEQIQGLEAIKRNSNQLKMLIGNILEISRLDSGRFDLNITEINIKEKTILIIDNLKVLCVNKDIELRCNLIYDGKITTDEMRFEEILNNLVGNAIKFTDTGHITITSELGTGPEV